MKLLPFVLVVAIFGCSLPAKRKFWEENDYGVQHRAEEPEKLNKDR